VLTLAGKQSTQAGKVGNEMNIINKKKIRFSALSKF